MKTRPDKVDCSVVRTLEIVGERWTLLVMREAYYGARRFEAMQRTLGCARNILSARLSTLVEHGLLSRVPYAEPGQRERYEYRLTDAGRALFPVIVALMQWGDRWLPAERGGPPVALLHRDCGEPIEAVLRCGRGHSALSVRDVEPVFRKKRASRTLRA